MREDVYIAYGRVSTEEQNAGLQVQRLSLERWAEHEGKTIAYVEDEGYSGGHAKRPALEAARARLASSSGPAGLVVARMDRLSRSLQDFAAIVSEATKQGWTLVCLDPPLDLSTPAGRMMANVLAVFAQYEREMIGERVKEVLAYKKIHGTATGNPIGRRSTLPDDVVRRILGDAARGLSNADIARSLNDDAVPTGQGAGQWWPSAVRAVRLRAA
jgi:DNA invertase Pin-like site-specific DNA recombinase